jgi:hypothetical protein
MSIMNYDGRSIDSAFAMECGEIKLYTKPSAAKRPRNE